MTLLYRSVNFWLMDIFTSLLVFSSALFGNVKRQKLTRCGKSVSSVENHTENQNDDNSTENSSLGSEKCFGATVVRRLFLYVAYFLLMAASVILFQSHPYVMISVQHFTVILCVLVAFLQWLKPRPAFCFGASFCIIWLLSAFTSLRWIINDIIIGFFALLVSKVQFQNFAFLQMFLWIAVTYDVCLVNTLSDGLPPFFSTGVCDSVLCQAFEINDAWQLPTIFTVRLGPKESHVFLGAGDIIIGCIVANFAQQFFRSSKHMSGTVMSYALAIAMLSWVDNEPYPALVTIVPLCTLQLIISAVISRKIRKLFSLKCLDLVEPKEGDNQELELLVF